MVPVRRFDPGPGSREVRDKHLLCLVEKIPLHPPKHEIAPGKVEIVSTQEQELVGCCSPLYPKDLARRTDTNILSRLLKDSR